MTRVQNIMGPGGSDVVLTIFRPSNGKTYDFKLVRREIRLHTVQGVDRIPGTADKWNYMLDKDAGVAYIRLSILPARVGRRVGEGPCGRHATRGCADWSSTCATTRAACSTWRSALSATSSRTARLCRRVAASNVSIANALAAGPDIVTFRS